MIYRANMFTYGEVGERLGGIRESEIYQQSAQGIENLVINEMGNLKIAKKFSENRFTNDLKEIIDTKYNFYVCITNENKVCTHRKENETIKERIAINNTQVSNINITKMCDDKLFVIGDNTYVFEFDKSNGNVGVSNFLNVLKLPIKDKEVLTIDVYKVYKVQQEYRVSLLGKYQNPKLNCTGNKIRLDGSNIEINRLYRQYKASVSKDNISDLTENMIFGIVHNYKTPTNDFKYYIGNEEITFTGEHTDNKYGGTYFTRVNKNVTGELNYGKLIKINEDITTVGLYQDRLVIVHEGMFYFSKKSDYFDFRNDTRIDSAFYFRPTPIDNIYPEIFDIYIADKIYVPNSKGIYVISTNNILSSNAYSVFIASEIPANKNSRITSENKCTLINNVFYYLTEQNELRSIEQTPSSQGLESYSTTLVEKYELNSKFEKIFKYRYNNKQYLVACRKINNKFQKLYMYEQLDFKLFRRFSLKLSKEFNNIIINGETIIADNLKLLESENNSESGILRLNPPYMKTEHGGNYSNDYSSRIVRVFIKVLNENKNAIKGVKIGETLVTKSAIDDDLFSVFKIECSYPVLNGFEIEVITKENNKIFEILGIDTKVDVISD